MWFFSFYWHNFGTVFLNFLFWKKISFKIQFWLGFLLKENLLLCFSIPWLMYLSTIFYHTSSVFFHGTKCITQLRNSASSFHRLSSSVCLFVCPASVTHPLISTIWCFWPYKPYIFCEDMILAACQHHNLQPYTFQSEFRIVFCCLFHIILSWNLHQPESHLFTFNKVSDSLASGPIDRTPKFTWVR